MTIFADSSALVTRYADEHGRPALPEPADLVVSQLARVEVPSAIWRKHRARELSAGAAGILDRAARLLAVHGLRADDAVQLASACVTADVSVECDTFAGCDRKLQQAAAAEGLRLFPGH